MSHKGAKEVIFNRFCSLLSELPLFDIETNENLTLTNSYICPLCKNVFDILELDKLSVEHVPPHSVGGKGIVLTCKDCNNQAGADIDKALHTELQSTDVSRLNNKMNAHLEIGPYRVNGQYSQNGNQISCFLDNKRNAPGVVDAAMNYLIESGGHYQVSVNVPMSDKPRDIEGSRFALLKSAYLYAFSIMGYPYILNNVIEQFRICMINRESYLLKTVIDLQLKKDFPVLPDGIYDANFTNGYKCYMVFLSCKLKESQTVKHYAIILPSCENEHYEGFCDCLQSGVKISFSKNKYRTLF